MTGATFDQRGPLIGRTAEMARLVALLDGAAAGRGGISLIGGDPGIGKSRLAEELAATAAMRGIAARWGRCIEQEGAPPFWPWIQIVRALARDLPPETLRAALGTGAAAVAEMLPEINERLPALSGLPALEPAQARFRLFDCVTTFLRAVAGLGTPLLIVLDDLHWADAASLSLLQFIAADAADTSLLIVATYRDGDLHPDHPLSATIADITRRPRTLRLALRGLDSGAVARLARTITATPPSESLVSALAGDTEGNPLFVIETLRLLEEDRRLEQAWSGDLWRGGIPMAVRGVIGRRLTHLSTACREVLMVAAVCGHQFDPRWPAEVSGITEGAARSALDEAEAARIVEPTPAGNYRFTHSLLRETLYDDLPRPRRAALHRQVGEVLERRAGDDPARAAALAHHFLQAGGTDAAAKSLDYACAGAARARQMYAYEDAVHQDTLALHALDRTAAPDAGRRCALLIDLAEDRHRSGEKPEVTRALIQQAAALARTLPADEAPALIARTALALCECVPVLDGRRQLVGPLLEEALQTEGEAAVPVRARLLARLSEELHSLGNLARARSLGRRAVAAARQAGDSATLADCLAARIATVASPDDFDERRAAAAELMRLGEDERRAETTLRALRWQIVDRLDHGDIIAVDAAISRFARSAEELRHPVYRRQLTMFRAVRALLDGDLAEAERLVLETIRLLGQARDPEVMRFLGNISYLIRREQGRGAEMEVTVRQAIGSFPRVPVYPAALALLHLDAGQETEARTLFERTFDEDFAGFPPAVAWLYTCALLAQISRAFGDMHRAALLYPRLAPYADLVVNAGTPGFCAGSVSHFLGLLAATLAVAPPSAADVAPLDAAVAQPQRAETIGMVAARHFEDALACHARMGARGLLAHTRYEYARFLIDASRVHPGGPVEEERTAKARSLLEQALATAQQTGMARLAALAADALTALAAPSSAAPSVPSGTYGGLTTREIDVLALLARGATNKEIAAALFISPDTVRQHTISIYRRLDVRGRAGATAWAARHGLIEG